MGVFCNLDSKNLKEIVILSVFYNYIRMKSHVNCMPVTQLGLGRPLLLYREQEVDTPWNGVLPLDG